MMSLSHTLKAVWHYVEFIKILMIKSKIYPFLSKNLALDKNTEIYNNSKIENYIQNAT